VISSVVHAHIYLIMQHTEYFSTYAYPLNSSAPSSTSDEQLISHLKTIISRINVYLGILIFVFGIVGNILNILILSQRPLRSNTCVLIFIASSIAGIITILSGLTARILSNWEAGISDTVRWVCKLRIFVSLTFRLVTFWMMMLATIDRWIVSSTNPRFRQLSSIKNVLRSILAIIFFSIIINCQVIYCYETNLSNAPLRCYTKNAQCRLLNDLIFGLVTIIVPLILIVIFGSMTILKIRSSPSRILPVTTVSVVNRPSQVIDHRRRRFKKTDRYLFTMLVIQVILLAFLTLPMAIQKLYITFTTNAKKSLLQHTIDSFVYQITLLMTFIAAGMQFYVNTLSGGTVFRKAVIDLQQLIIRKVICR
jgi:uncharacterized membrane protein (DUF485 family)